MPLPRLLILPAVAALLALAVPAAPASAGATMCPCWPGGVPLASPLVCYAAPGAVTNTFAYLAPPPTFLQATTAWCRNNASFAWTSPTQSAACDESLQCLCDNPAPGAEVTCNGEDDDCNPATPDEAAELCDNGIDDDCDGAIDGNDLDCILAVAYIDVNDNDTYEHATDVLIARIVDSNDSGGLSAGDTLEADKYPGSVNSIVTGGEFTVKSLPCVAAYVTSSNPTCAVDADPAPFGTGYFFSVLPGIQEAFGFRAGGTTSAHIRDRHDNSSQDGIFMNPTQILMPQTALSDFLTPGPGDQNFMDILINP